MFYPTKTETFSTRYSRSEVEALLHASINPPVDDEGEELKKWFNGKVEKDAFKISLYLKRPNNYLPIMSGMIEPGDNGGSLLLVKYELFPASKKLLAFWTVITLILTLFFIFPYEAYWYAIICFSACLMNYIITYENFKLQVKKSRSALERVLS